MRDAARALDDVSDHLGEVLRRADELLVEWSRLGVQVRAQVEREVASIGEIVDGAVARAAGSGIDRAIADRLRALTAELERLEQRTRAASRAVVEQREGDRRVLWIVVAGVVLANALLVALLLRKPDAAPVAEPIRIEAPAGTTAQPLDPKQSPESTTQPAGAADSTPPAGATGTLAAQPAANAGATGGAPPSNAGTGGVPASGAGVNGPSASGAGVNGPSASGTGLNGPSASGAGTTSASPASSAGGNAAGAKQGPGAASSGAGRSGPGAPAGAAKAGNAPSAPTRPSSSPSSSQPGGVRPMTEPPRLTPSPIVLPPKSSNAHGHKKQP